MRQHSRSFSYLASAALLAIGTACAPKADPAAMNAAADSARAATAATFMTDMSKDVAQVEEKMVALANAIPEAKYDWRPAKGVRSVGEVFKHLSSDNYLIPAALGVMAPEATGIKNGDYASASAFEARKMDRATVVSEMQASFAHVKKAMADAKPAMMGENVDMFGQKFTQQAVWVLSTTHLHEHLGQMIAYARMNGVVPPWSK